MTDSLWLLSKSKSSVTAPISQKNNSGFLMPSCESAPVISDIVWLFLSPSFFTSPHDIGNSWVRKDSQEHEFKTVLMTVTCTELNSKAGGQLNMHKDTLCYCPP